MNGEFLNMNAVRRYPFFWGRVCHYPKALLVRPIRCHAGCTLVLKIIMIQRMEKIRNKNHNTNNNNIMDLLIERKVKIYQTSIIISLLAVRDATHNPLD